MRMVDKFANPDDLPYGPGSTDYEYDGWRDRNDSDRDAETAALRDRQAEETPASEWK